MDKSRSDIDLCIRHADVYLHTHRIARFSPRQHKRTHTTTTSSLSHTPTHPRPHTHSPTHPPTHSPTHPLASHARAVEAVQDPVRYFAKRLNKTMKGFGTRDLNLIRILVTRAEVDLKEIADAYFEVRCMIYTYIYICIYII